MDNKILKSAFGSGTDPDFFFSSKNHSEALARLLYVSKDSGVNIGVVTGEIGSGKTLLCKTLLQKLNPSRFKAVFIPSSNTDYESILDHIIYQLTGRHSPFERSRDRHYLMIKLNEILQQVCSRSGRHLILILDEAQMLDKNCLENLKCLTNSTLKNSPVTIIFSAQPEFRGLLQQSPAVSQRIGLMYYLNYLNQEEVDPYIKHRLNMSGNNLEIEPEASEALYNFSRGCPREINKVCKIACEEVLQNSSKTLSCSIVDMIIEDIYQQRDFLHTVL